MCTYSTVNFEEHIYVWKSQSKVKCACKGIIVVIHKQKLIMKAFISSQFSYCPFSVDEP